MRIVEFVDCNTRVEVELLLPEVIAIFLLVVANVDNAVPKQF